MNTPLYDFLEFYKNENTIRLHMPGHKGKEIIGVEKYDITEISGADVLYQENGVLRESQENATSLFSSGKTLYSTEGSTLAIRAMMYLADIDAKNHNTRIKIASPRNAHKAFLTACALLDFDPVWIENENDRSVFGNILTAEKLSVFFDNEKEKPTAVYVTSPDYLGNVLDIEELAAVCHKNGALLLVDNAHGSYLHFLPESLHPISLGADMVCDSAHKTLPVLTGGAYLHLSKSLSKDLISQAPIAMSLFASTSPSYLILQSLDRCNQYLAEDLPNILYPFLGKLVDFKKELKKDGWVLCGNEPLKITLSTKEKGYLGTEVADLLEKDGIVVEFSDPDYLVMMLSPQMSSKTLEKIRNSLLKIKNQDPILDFCPAFPKARKIITPREAMLAPSEEVDLNSAVGRILSSPAVSCPPAIPIVVCGEEIQKEHLAIFNYYNIKKLFVKKETI